MYHLLAADRRLSAKIQAPLVLAEIRALRASIFKSSPEVQRALAIAEKIEQRYDLSRTDLFLPAADTCCAILEPFAMTVLTECVASGAGVKTTWLSLPGSLEGSSLPGPFNS